ncbi:efflux RND transporter periplasmic adaptor subunit [Psychromonas algicola]|uniref:efflux RND transporter periplasmic adaptor subunit n=1 Tax=Psychromonas algicola TaxID=2555642 RepID=UPI0010680773|nr:efflux RND transporter periplasmic adaptor subunit [Psychromonas sp. RZ5]TEW44088.1 efflux RND transporter periplasmic adaptor subunit [Psychromonas sp. RZ5]
MDIKLSWKKRFLWIPPIILGILVIILAPLVKQAPPQSTKTPSAKVVRIIKMQPRSIQPSVTGYGYIQPANDWQVQSELSGTISWIADNLGNGSLIKKGDVVLKIDPTPYLLSKAQLQAQLDVAEIKDKTIQASIKIAQQDYDLQKNELARYERLSKEGNISKTTRDNSERAFLNSQQQLQTLKNNLLINSAEQKVLSSQLAIIELDLEKTVLHAPFDVRLVEFNVGLAEYVNRGELLFKADGLNAAEVSAQFPIGKMRPLRKSAQQNTLNTGLHSELQATVELQAIDKVISWQGKVERTGGVLDTQTQSQSIVVRIDDPYQKSSPGERPPLIRNTFVKVTLKAPALNKQLLLPITAIHNNQVYVLSEDNKLQIKDIDVDFVQQQVAVIRSGLSAADNVILSPLSPAIEGMNLKAMQDNKMLDWLEQTTGFAIDKTPQSGGLL